MSIKVKQLTDFECPAFQRFVQLAWPARPRGPEYYEWRYQRVPNLVTFVAVNERECLASISAFRVPYTFGEKTQECLEPFDWFCAPELRWTGLGIRVLRAL